MDQVIFRDGLGERRRLTNASNTERLDVLCLDWELTSVPAFEPALRARVARLSSFHHPGFAAVRGVQRVGEAKASTLAVAYDAAPGVRLTELLAAGERKAVALDIGTAVFLIRQLVAAIAALHEDGEDLSHGAIALERLVITPDARLIVVEHMLGPAIEELQFSHARLWEDLRVATPRSIAPPQLDQRSDCMQIGIAALSLLLARPITNDEYPGHIQDLVATAWAVSARGNLEPVPAGLRAWLTRALQLDMRASFSSAIEARTDLNKMFGAEAATSTPAALKAFLAKQQPAAAVAAAAAPPLAPPPSAEPEPEFELELDTEPEPEPSIPEPVFPAPMLMDTPPPQPAIVDTPRPVAIVEPVQVPAPLPVAAPAPTRILDTPRPAAVPPVQPIPPLPPVPPVSPVQPIARVRIHESSKWVTAIAACALIVLASGGVFAARRYLKPSAAAPAFGRLVINTNPDGATVIVDGQPKGVTPLTLTVTAGAHAVELHGQGEPRRMSVNVDAGAEVAQYIELPKSAPTLGALQVKSDPGGATVTVDGIPRGVSPVTVTGLAPGEHAVLVEGNAGSTKQTVVVDPGVTASLTAQLSNQGAPASGWISVSAPAEVQLFENGQLVGSSQTDKLMVLAGSHQLELVNQALGYRATKSVQVTAGRTSTIKVEFPNGTIALNATPWADVWIDGAPVGQTPIGNLPIAIGSHEITFRHPDLGEQKHTAMVTLDTPTRLSVDMRKKP